jgi:hypothetical protein
MVRVTFVVQPLINSDSACATVCVRVRPLNHKPKPKPKDSAHPCPAQSHTSSLRVSLLPRKCLLLCGPRCECDEKRVSTQANLVRSNYDGNSIIASGTQFNFSQVSWTTMFNTPAPSRVGHGGSESGTQGGHTAYQSISATQSAGLFRGTPLFAKPQKYVSVHHN